MLFLVKVPGLYGLGTLTCLKTGQVPKYILEYTVHIYSWRPSDAQNEVALAQLALSTYFTIHTLLSCDSKSQVLDRCADATA